ncbi:MAG: glycosyltransferase family 39 protein, partial [Candidatus Doudnabacteria bacterium]|nr:glycosyltransferase family 39 protein [Candidatus Doudnabacteria bacterium]
MKKYWLITLILIIGTALRFWHNTDISLWHDEAFSALLIKYPWHEMFYRIGLDVHPPMYYIFLRLWHYIFGDSLLSLRGFTVFFSVGTIWAVWMFVKEAFKDGKYAIWAALLVAFNPFQIQYATEARMYTMGAFFAVLAAYFLTKALHLQKDLYQDSQNHIPNLPEYFEDRRRMLWNYLGFSLSVIILIYTHYYLLFTAAAICFYGLVYLYFHHEGSIKKYLYILISYLLIFISFIPWLKTFLFQYKQVGAGYWIPPMDRWSVPSTLWTLIIGIGHDINNPTTQKLLILITLFTFYFLYRFLRKTQSFEKWLVASCVLAPFGGALLFYLLARMKGSNSSVFLVRYFLYTSAFLSIALAVWLKEIKIKIVGYFLFAVYLIANLFAFNNYWHQLNIKTKPGMSAASKYLKANLEPQHKLYVGSSFIFFNQKYYLWHEKIANHPLLFSGGNR